MAKYPGTLESNNPQAFGIVYADEVSGHKSVEDLNALYTISDAILSKSKTNENDDAIGQDWYVRSKANYYRLIDWSKRKTAEGWKQQLIGSDGNNSLSNYIPQSEKDVANGVPSLNSSGVLNHSQIPALKFWQVAEAVTDKEAIVSQGSKGKDYNLNVYNGNRDIDANSFNVVLEKGLHKELDLVKTEIESKIFSKSITRGTISEYEPDTTHKDVLYYATDIDCVIYNKKQVSGPIYVGYVTEIPEIVTLDGNEFPIETEQAHVTCGNIQSIIQACNKLGSIECVVDIGIRKNSSKEFTVVLKIEYSNKEGFLTWASVPLDNYGIFNEGDLCEHYNYKVDIGGSAEEGMLLYFIPVSKQNQFLADAIITTQASYSAITNKNNKTFYIVD